MLCKEYSPELVKFPCLVQAKYDGVRGLFVKELEDKVSAYFRSGKPIYSVQHLERECLCILKDYPIGSFLDGELLIPNESFEVSAGLLRRKEEQCNALLYVFDFIINDKYLMDDVLIERAIDISTQYNCEHIKYVKTEYVEDSLDKVDEIYNKLISEGYEGAVIKYLFSSYEFGKRSESWLKRKPILTEDVVVLGLLEGIGKYKGMLGKMLIQLPNGLQQTVGSGLTDKQREEFWNNEDIIGSTVEVSYMKKTSSGKLRQPIFKRMRFDK